VGATVLEKKSFDEKIINNGETALVDFFANWCMPCKMFSPVLDAISEEFEGKVNCYKVNVDNDSEIAAKYKIMSIPAILLFKDGEVLDSFNGSLPKEKVRDFLNKNIGE
jgi:thioredoxin